MRVSDLFYSLQGEGMLAGTPSVFVRLAGCPFRCRWCDTAYAWDYGAGDELDQNHIVERVGQWPCRFVVLTGGEPLIGPDGSVRPGVVELSHHLTDLGKHITIETAGAQFVPDLACDLMSISPKLMNAALQEKVSGTFSNGGSEGAARKKYLTPFSDAVSHVEMHQTDRLDVETIRRLIQAYPYQLKFVIETPTDVEEIRGVLDRLGDIAPERVLLMPQAATTKELLDRSPMVARACQQAGLRFGQRLHILLWDRQRGV